MHSRRAIWLILATIFLDAVGVGLVFPMMPDLMQRVGAGSAADAAIWGGIMMSAYAAMQFVCAPVIGGISDAMGRRPVLLLALGVLCADYVIMALATTYWMLLAGRVLAGVAGASYITATAYLADISAPGDRAANFGLIGASFGLGFVLGPAIGGLAAGWHIAAPFWLAAGLAGLNFGFALFILPESLAPGNRRAFRRSDLNPFGAIRAAFAMPGLALPLALLFVFEFANLVYPTLWAFWGREVFGWSAAMIGLSLAAYGISVTITQAGLLRPAVARAGEYRVMVFGLVCGVISMVGYGVISAAWLVFVLMPVAAMSDMVPPTMTAMMANRVEDARQGLLQGVIASLGSIAAIAAPVVMTGTFHRFAGPDVPVYLPGAPYLLAAGMVAVALPLFLRLRPGR